jgi:hypothetical protein
VASVNFAGVTNKAGMTGSFDARTAAPTLLKACRFNRLG